ncbi:hypothetical protein KY290_014946 [Solanum tuberosum]|uniref:BZIP domain-containing protein n=1 Tax=Solanum tuberosum TaxID=4113 RepID=A0ABQ7VR54_SOLTU|nr:hypothetical protein KY285_014386 [Solanum tuberosum]KAH0770965.1 hypothetical protein KY290_014946 [Solanum tuberosum]
MEEVWKDINLSSLQDHTTNYSKDHQHHLHDHNHQGANFGGMILQDFLARPFADESSPAASPVSATTMLNLNSVPELHFFDNPLRQNSILHQPNVSRRKRVVPETEDNSTGDRRNRRMIKNRESASRSRARKQESDTLFILIIICSSINLFCCPAYLNELETEVAHLVEENVRLKKQQQQLLLAAAIQVPKKNSLHRTSSAPF